MELNLSICELLIRERVSCYVLFHAMLIHGVVPSMFGIGIIVPLFKGHNLDSSISDNYRGITLL